MTTPLANKVAEVVDSALVSQEGVVVWRGDVSGEEWKISADYNGIKEEILVRIKRRDPEVIEWLNV